jgi:hypothetical protein
MSFYNLGKDRRFPLSLALVSLALASLALALRPKLGNKKEPHLKWLFLK